MSETPSVPDLKVVEGKPPVEMPDWASEMLREAGAELFAVSKRREEAHQAVARATQDLENIRAQAQQVEAEAGHVSGKLGGVVAAVLKSIGLTRDDVSGYYDAAKDTFVLVHEKAPAPKKA